MVALWHAVEQKYKNKSSLHLALRAPRIIDTGWSLMTGRHIPVVAADSGKGSTFAPSTPVAAADPGGYPLLPPPDHTPHQIKTVFFRGSFRTLFFVCVCRLLVKK